VVTKSQLVNLAGITRYYATRPSRAGEVWRWVRLRGQMTDLRLPWWPLAASDAVAASLPLGARVFEFGGGGSTLWLVDQGAEVTCVEHDRTWHDLLATKLAGLARILLVEPTPQGRVRSSNHTDRYFDDYVHAIDSQSDESLDLVIVDGRARIACGLAAISKIRRGGWLLLDDSDRPRYRELGATVEAAGWQRHDFRGARPGGGQITQSTVWVKPF
jgi:hypothetical protein